MSEIEKLDNPVWHSLNERQKQNALEYGNYKFFQTDYCAFGGFENDNSDTEPLEQYARHIDQFIIFGPKPDIPQTLRLKQELICHQMIIEKPIEISLKNEIVSLDMSHRDLLLELVKLAYPAYFRIKTADLGNYFGIFKEDQLVAITGERMKTNACTEVSAVITHPQHTGMGYAKQLITHTVNNIFQDNKMPFLHVAASNTPAIALYEKLGFRTRKMISLWNIVSE